MKTRVYIAGHTGMVGSALTRKLAADSNIEIIERDRAELDLTRQEQVEAFFKDEEIHQVYLAAAKAGGIHANNQYPAEFIYNNLMIEGNVIHGAYQAGVKKLIFLGSSCIYPRLATQPMKESELLSGKLELTNEPYAVAKIAGIKLCESYSRQYGVDFRSVMPTNLYGQNDNFHPDNGHVIPAMIQRFHAAKVEQQPEVVIWGSGKPMREFLYVDDLADACVHVMNLATEEYRAAVDERLSHINIGVGVDCSIKELAELIARIVGYTGAMRFDTSKPDGTPRKLLDVSLINSLGWQSSISLEQGLQKTYQWYLKNHDHLRGAA